MGRTKKSPTLSLPKGRPRSLREARARELLYCREEPEVSIKSNKARGIVRNIIENVFADPSSPVSRDVQGLNPQAFYSLLPLDLLKKRSSDLGQVEVSRRLKELQAASYLPLILGFGIDHAIANGNMVQLVPDEETSKLLRPELELIRDYFPSDKDDLVIPNLTLSTSWDMSIANETAMVIDAYVASHPDSTPITLGKIEIET